MAYLRVGFVFLLFVGICLAQQDTPVPPRSSGLTISDGVMVFAVLLAPLTSGLVLWWLQLWREKRERKVWIFRTLMATRAERLSLYHVQALNLIELEFRDKGAERPIVRAWKEYIDHLGTPDPGTNVDAFYRERDNHLIDLLSKMGKRLGYDFDTITIRKHGYVPKDWGDVDAETRFIRRGVAELFFGKRYFLTNFPSEHGPVGVKMTIERDADGPAAPSPQRPATQPEQSEPPRQEATPSPSKQS